MNGLEALNKLKNEDYCNCSLSADNDYFCMGGRLQQSKELKAIESELKILNLLKEKQVDLEFIRNFVNCQIEDLLQDYNNMCEEIEKPKLTEEEMTLIVEWLKGE